MGDLTVQIALSMPRVEAWVANKIGIKRAKLPNIEAVTAAVEELFRENSLYGAASFEFLPTNDESQVAVVISGDGPDFRKACQLLESQFAEP